MQFLITLLLLLQVLYTASTKAGHAPMSDMQKNTVLTLNMQPLDSAAIGLFFNTFSATDSVKKEVYQFYKTRKYQFAWLSENGLTVAAANFYVQIKADGRDFADGTLSNSLLDSLYNAVQDNTELFLSQKNKPTLLELVLTTSFFKYARRMYGGITKESASLEWFIPRKKKNYMALVDSLAVLPAGKLLQEPVNQYYIRLKQQLTIYRDIEKNGGWPTLPINKKTPAVLINDSANLTIKKYLVITRDLQVNDGSLLFSDSLTNAIKNYQTRMGLVVNGKTDKATLREMNVPVADRILQIMVNMERLRWAPVEMEPGYLLVNIPEFKLHVFENNKAVWTTNVVVGKVLRQTNIFRDNVSQIIFNPYWDVPASIANKEILPHIRRNTEYLKNNNMEVISNHPFAVRQKPGINNSLGKMKFLFPNSYNIYLHDTPAKNLFGQNLRAFSHGCVRVQDPLWLARYLLRNDASWTSEKINGILETDKEYPVAVKPVVPVYIAYFTAWVNAGGEINFRHDLYGLDKKIATEIFDKTQYKPSLSSEKK